MLTQVDVEKLLLRVSLSRGSRDVSVNQKP
jgi:hypothetical protein